MGNRRFIEREPFPNQFRAWREYRQMTQTEVEQMYGWPASRVSNLENGRATVTGHVMMALARAYRCTVGDLISRDPGPVAGLGGALPAGGLAALHDALAAISRVAAEAAAIRSDVLPRLQTLEREVADAAERITAALQDTAALAETFERAAGTLRATTAAPAPAEVAADDGK